MRQEIELAYVGVEIPDPSTLTAFFADVIGLAPGEPGAEGSTSWRNDDAVHRVIVDRGPANDLAFLGFAARDAQAFEAVTARLADAGFDLSDGTLEDRRGRRVGRLVRTSAPWGVPVEIVLDLQRASTPFSSPLAPGGFLTEGVGLGHAVVATPAFDEADRFVVEGLGLVQSDWLEMEIAAGINLEVRFYHGNSRHHSLARARAPFELPQKLHHIMFETKERDDVGAAFDRAWATDLPIPNGLGRHDNDGMFSFYVASPAGFQVEVGHGARVITDDWADNRRYDRISAWGHQPLRQG